MENNLQRYNFVGKMVVFYCETGQVKYIIESSNK